MKKIVNLMGNVARLEDLEPFIIGVNDFLDLEFKSAYYLPTDLVICLKNGKLQENFRVKDAKLNVPGNFLFSGKLEMTVSLLVNGDVAKKWTCVPIIIKETDTEITAFDELEEVVAEAQTPPSPAPTADEDSGEPEAPAMLPGYAQLYAENPDLFGWVQIPDTELSYRNCFWRR